MADTKGSGNGAVQAKPANKMEAVRQALQKMGKDPKAADIQKFVKTAFGIEIKINHIYNCLSEIRKQSQKGPAKPQVKKLAAPAPAPAAPAPAQVRAASPSRPVPTAKGGTGGIDLEDIAAAKGLLERVGPDKLRALLDVLAG